MKKVSEKDEVKARKSKLLREMDEAAYEILGECPVMALEDFEEALAAKFPKEAKLLSEPLKNSKRAEWLNLTDWVKAWMTKRGHTRYFDKHSIRYIVYLPPCGQIRDKSLVWMAHADKVIDHLVEMFGGEVVR